MKEKIIFGSLLQLHLALILLMFMLAPIQPLEHNFTVSEPETTLAPEIIDTTLFPANSKTTIDTVKNSEVAKEIVKVELNEPEKHKSGYSQYFASIDKGRKTLCFFVPGCDHCREAAKELTELKKTTKNFPEISIIFMNEEADLIPDFFKRSWSRISF